MHFQNFRRREAAHQGLAHTRRVGAGAGGKQQRLGHRFDVECHDDLVGHLGGLAVTIAADQRDVLAHQLEQRLDAFKHGFRAADHDGQRRIFGTDFAAGYRGVEVVATQRVDFLRKGLGGDRRDRAHVDDHLAHARGRVAGWSLESGGDTCLAEQRSFHIGGVGHHHEDDVRTFGDAAGAQALGGTAAGNCLGHLAAGVDKQLVAGIDQVAGHGRAHDAQANEADFQGV